MKKCIKLKSNLGGKTTAIINRKFALTNYYSNPNICKNCNKVIRVKQNQKVSYVRTKKFCNRSCAASFNQRGKPSKNKPIYIKKFCNYCGESFIRGRNKKGILLNSNYCETCISNKNNYKNKFKNTKLILVENCTKKEIFGKRKNWQSARSAIRKNACKVFKESGKELKCKICNYTLHVEICHIKDVKDFKDSVKISVINNISNLVPLCPTHHWEFDNKIIKIKQ